MLGACGRRGRRGDLRATMAPNNYTDSPLLTGEEFERAHLGTFDERNHRATRPRLISDPPHRASEPLTIANMRVKTWLPVAAAGLLLLGTAAPASADVEGYVRALEAAELIDHDGDSYHCRADVCFGQFDDADAALQTGRWVCEQMRKVGKPRALLVDWLSHGEGLMPSSYSAPIIVDAAATHLCP